MRVAAIDIGTNTCLLLIAESVTNNGMRVLADEHSIVRLGENVDKTRNISDTAYARLVASLQQYAVIAKDYNVSRIHAVGTSAMRDALNSGQIISQLESTFGYRIEIISGAREAGFTYAGAMYGFATSSEDTAVIDIGGGSTEIAFGSHSIYRQGKSFDVGAVRLTERGISKSTLHDTQRMLASLFTNIEEFLDAKPKKLVAVAGTPTTLAAMRNKLLQFDKSKVHGEVLSINEIESLLDEMLTISADDLIKAYPAIHLGRADILPAGTAILIEAMKALRVNEVTVSANGLRYGVALEMLFPIE